MNTMEANTIPVLLTSAQAAKTLAISPRTLWTLTNDGRLPCVRVGRSVRYDAADLARWINEHKTFVPLHENAAVC